MRSGSLFSGIGGLDLAVEAATGARTVWQVERDAWCRGVLARHWPDARRYEDVCTAGTDGQELEHVDIIAGGFPCQDVSTAGKRAGIERGARSGLWREFARIVRVVRPRFVFVENVAGLLSMEFGHVLGDLAALGFDAEWTVLRASDAGAPHRRERVFVLAVAHPERRGRREGWLPRMGYPVVSGGGCADDATTLAHPSARAVADGERLESPSADGVVVGRRSCFGGIRCGERRANNGCAQPRLGRGANGLSCGLAGHRWPAGRGEAQHEGEPPRVIVGATDRARKLRALGNAVVPQQAALAWHVLYERLSARLDLLPLEPRS